MIYVDDMFTIIGPRVKYRLSVEHRFHWFKRCLQSPVTSVHIHILLHGSRHAALLKKPNLTYPDAAMQEYHTCLHSQKNVVMYYAYYVYNWPNVAHTAGLANEDVRS